MKPITLLFAVTVVSLLAAPYSAAVAGSIKKCKDAQGRWHYGSSAAKACAHSEVIEFKAGKAGKTIHAPAPTKEELNKLKATKRAAKQKKEQLAEQAAQDKLLAASYSHEDDIIYERNRKLKDLQAGLDSGEATLASLKAVRDRTQKRAKEEKASGKGVSKVTEKTFASANRQVKRHERAVQEKTRELEEMKRYYKHALERYRAMKQRRTTNGQ